MAPKCIQQQQQQCLCRESETESEDFFANLSETVRLQDFENRKNTNIITPRNYFTRELLHDSNVAFHCKKSLVAIFGGKLFGGSVLAAQYCPCGQISPKCRSG